MATLPYRILRNEPGRLEESLARDGVVILSKNGEPFAVMLDAQTRSLDSVVRIASQVRAMLSVSEIRTLARERGLDRMAAEEIQAEIEAARSTRRE
jgi:uncharacterized protein YjcR